MCQHKFLSELGYECWYYNLLKYIINHIIFNYKKKKRAIYGKLRKKILTNNQEGRDITEHPIKQGDIVNILSKMELIDILDYDGKYKRCQFMDEMYNYCKGKYKVSKKINYFYDAGINKICRCKDLFLLEGLTCQGKKGIPFEICNLNCYFFWHSAWLVKHKER
jgi:hypothetical protein